MPCHLLRPDITKGRAEYSNTRTAPGFISVYAKLEKFSSSNLTAPVPLDPNKCILSRCRREDRLLFRAPAAEQPEFNPATIQSASTKPSFRSSVRYMLYRHDLAKLRRRSICLVCATRLLRRRRRYARAYFPFTVPEEFRENYLCLFVRPAALQREENEVVIRQGGLEVFSRKTTALSNRSFSHSSVRILSSFLHPSR